ESETIGEGMRMDLLHASCLVWLAVLVINPRERSTDEGEARDGHGLVQSFDTPKAESRVQFQGPLVLRRHFQASAAQPGLAEAIQREEQQQRPKPLAAVVRQHAEVLNRPDA